MSLQDYDLSPSEAEFFASRGSKVAQLLVENEALEPDRERASTERAGGDPDRTEISEEERAAAVARAADKGKPDVVAAPDEDADPHAPIDPAKPPRRVSYNRFKTAEDQRAKLETDMRALQEKWNRGDERLRLIQEALATDAQVKEEATRQQPDADPEPNMNEDIFKWAAWAQRNSIRQQESNERALSEMRDQVNQDRQARWFEAEQQSFASREPKYPLAYEFLLYARKQELMDELGLEGHDANEVERLALKELEEEVTEHVGSMRKAKKSPAQSFYLKAQNRTLKVPTQDGGSKRITMDEFIQLRQQQANGGRAPAVPATQPGVRQNSLAGSGTGSPQSGAAANQASAGPATPEKPKPSEIIAAIKAGQDASKSLSNGGGGAALQDLDMNTIVNLPMDEFQAVFNALQRAPGKDKARLRAVFGD
jgi:hypothetical protein